MKTPKIRVDSEHRLLVDVPDPRLWSRFIRIPLLFVCMIVVTYGVGAIAINEMVLPDSFKLSWFDRLSICVGAGGLLGIAARLLHIPTVVARAADLQEAVDKTILRKVSEQLPLSSGELCRLAAIESARRSLSTKFSGECGFHTITEPECDNDADGS